MSRLATATQLPIAFDLLTERLRLRPLALADAATLHQLWTAPGVRRFLWDGEIVPPERTLEIVERNADLFATEGLGLWGAHTHPREELVGFGGLWYFREPPQLELLFGVAEASWGHGLGTEIARAVVDYAFGPLGLKRVSASTDVGNSESIRVLDKVGFRFRERKVVGGLDTLFYHIERRPPDAVIRRLSY